MDFYKLITSLDELLYEVMSWLLFYPVTLWRACVHPVRMIGYAEEEMDKPETERFIDTLNPPLFLFLTLIVLHLVELAIIGQSELVTDRHGFRAYVDSDTTLLVLRIMLFGLFPLLLARRKLIARNMGVNRETLRQPFYAQCYATTVFALLVGSASLLSRLPHPTALAGAFGVVLFAFLWLGVVETEFYRSRLGISRLKAFGHSSRVMAEGVVIIGFAGTILS